MPFEKGAQPFPNHAALAGGAIPMNHAQLDTGWVSGLVERAIIEINEFPAGLLPTCGHVGQVHALSFLTANVFN